MSDTATSGIKYGGIPGTNIFEISVDGKVTPEEYNRAIDAYLDFFNKHEKVKVLKVIHNFEGFDIAMIKDRIAQIGDLWSRIGDISAAAAVTDEKWIHQLTGMLSKAYPFPTKVFELNQLEEARNWLQTTGDSTSSN